MCSGSAPSMRASIYVRLLISKKLGELLKMASPYLAEVLASRRWERALFTTFSLSLTFFETEILPTLRRQGCRDVWIVTDAVGYRASLTERRSTRIGQEYRVVPVGLPDGVFHPKCTFLAGPGGDLLLVGSGNLTFSGQGRNLEVIEVLPSDREGRAHLDFATFLDALRVRPDFIAGDLSWAKTFAQRARESGRNESGNARLIHTVETPAIQQIGAMVKVPGGARRLVVLSPYHDLDGRTVLELARVVSAREIVIGLPPAENASSPFPFAMTAGWDRAVTAAQPVVELASQRPLHAKWIEVRLPEETLTITGSLNATRPALRTIDNIEVGVVRREPASPSSERWTDVPVPANYTPPVYRKGGIGSGYLLQAAIRAGGTLHGRLLGKSTAPCAGEWATRLLLRNGDQVELSVAVDEEGAFSTELQSPERFAYASSLQLEMTRGERRARGWVQLDELLEVSRLSRLGVGTLLRLINREETDDDDIALLDYFSLSASQHLETFALRIGTSHPADRDEGAQERDVVVDLEALTPGDATPQAEEDAGSSDSSRAALALERVLAQLRKRLLTEPGSPGAAPGTPFHLDGGGQEEEEDEEEGNKGTEAAGQRRVDAALERFNDSMQDLAANAATEPARCGALVLWFETSMNMYLRRRKDRSAATAFLRRWFHLACGSTRWPAAQGALSQHTFTAAALLPMLTSAADPAATRVEIHDALERFMGGDVSPETASGELLTTTSVGFASLLIDEDPGELHASLREVLATRTRRRLLQEAMARYRDGKVPDPGSPLFAKDQPLARELLRALSRPPPRARPIFKEQMESAPTCAHCFVALSTTAAHHLARDRAALCDSCGRFTVRTRP